MQSSLGTGPSTSELVMCMLVVMPLTVPSPLSPQPAGPWQGVYVRVHCPLCRHDHHGLVVLVASRMCRCVTALPGGLLGHSMQWYPKPWAASVPAAG